MTEVIVCRYCQCDIMLQIAGERAGTDADTSTRMPSSNSFELALAQCARGGPFVACSALRFDALGPGKTRTHCGGNIVSYDVARPWQNEATLLRAARTKEMFLKIFRNIFCVQDTKFVSDTNVARVAKRGHIWET